MKILRAEEGDPAWEGPITGSQPRARAVPPPLKKLSVLMPVYNELWTLREIVARVLASPVPLEIELIIVDDCSRDGSWDVIRELAAADSRIRPVRHARNGGKGTAIRTAIEHLTGDVAIVQDADLEYDPQQYPQLLEPLLEGKADAVFGSRYAGSTHRVHRFWHSLVNRGLTLLSNMVNDLNLTDMETCYKMVRTDILKQLRLRSRTFTFEPELTCRLAQWGARIYEVPVSYDNRTYADGKKIRPRDGLLAIGEIFRCRYLDPRFTHRDNLYALARQARANKLNRRILDLVGPYLGPRLLEVGAGLGSFSGRLVQRDRLILLDDEPLCTAVLRQRFGWRRNVDVAAANLIRPADLRPWESENLDTIFCTRPVDAHMLEGFYRTVQPAGHCILVASSDMARKLTAAGFDVVFAHRLSRLGAFGSLFSRAPLAAGSPLVLVGRKPTRPARQIAA